MRQLAFSIGLSVFLVSFTSACGTKGPLTLPAATVSPVKQENKPVSMADVNTVAGQH